MSQNLIQSIPSSDPRESAEHCQAHSEKSTDSLKPLCGSHLLPSKTTSDCDSVSTQSAPSSPSAAKAKRHCKVRAKERTHRQKVTQPRVQTQTHLLSTIERLLQEQAPITSHKPDFSDLNISDKHSLLDQLKNRVTLIESTMMAATSALEQLLRMM